MTHDDILLYIINEIPLTVARDIIDDNNTPEDVRQLISLIRCIR